jgi:hypothetical protein
MARLDNWNTDLSALIEEKRFLPFDWPTFNCVIWASQAVQIVNGLDIHAPYVGKYKTANGSLKQLRKIDNVKTPIELFQKYLGELQPISLARKGDLVFTKDVQEGINIASDSKAFGPVVGVCYGHTSFFVGAEGLIEVETLQLGQALWVN